MKNQKIIVSNSNLEFLLDIDDNRLIMSPVTAKNFLNLLSQNIISYEKKNGKIVLTKEQNIFSQNLLKNLFHNKKVSKKLSVIGKKKQ